MIDVASVIPHSYHKCGDNWIMMTGHWWMSPGSQPESPATGVSVLASLSHSHSPPPVQCTVTSLLILTLTTRMHCLPPES